MRFAPFRIGEMCLYTKNDDYHGKQSLHDGKRHIEAHQALQNALHGWYDHLISAEHSFFRHKVVVYRIYQEVVGYHGKYTHDHRTEQGSNQCASALFLWR